MGKAPLILQYLHDHARLVCDRRNEKDGPGSWRITPVPDEQRRNIIFHYGTNENFTEFFNNKPAVVQKPEPDSPTLNYCEINLKSLERREMMRMTERKATATKSRLTLKPKAKVGGIFSNGIQANSRILITDSTNIEDSRDTVSHDHHTKSPSTSSIYVDSSDDFEADLFNEPEDLEQARLQHQKDLYAESDWFNETVNFTQSQPRGFIPRHRDYYHFNSQK